jgi:hypothetical protein
MHCQSLESMECTLAYPFRKKNVSYEISRKLLNCSYVREKCNMRSYLIETLFVCSKLQIHMLHGDISFETFPCFKLS